MADDMATSLFSLKIHRPPQNKKKITKISPKLPIKNIYRNVNHKWTTVMLIEMDGGDMVLSKRPDPQRIFK